MDKEENVVDETVEVEKAESKPRMGHDEALDALAETRRESADRRIKIKELTDQVSELQAKLEGATSLEDFQKVSLENKKLAEQNAQLAEELLRADVVAEKGIPREAGKFLTGDAESMRKQADDLLAAFSSAANGGGQKSVEVFDGGHKQENEQGQDFDPEAFAAKIYNGWR